MSFTGTKSTAARNGDVKPDSRVLQTTFRRWTLTLSEHRWQLLCLLLAGTLLLVLLVPKARSTYCPIALTNQITIAGYTCTAGYDFNGNDLTGSGHQQTTQDCAASCSARKDCAFFIYETSGNCWIKRDLNQGKNGNTKPKASCLTACIKEKK